MEALLIYITKSAGILTLFVIIYGIFLKRETLFTANRWFLLAGCVGAVGLPLLQFTKTVWVAPMPVSTATFLETPLTQVIENTGFTPNWWLVALVIYGIGVLIMLSRLLIQLASLQKLLGNNDTYQKEGIYYTEVDDAIAPFSFGNHIVYNSSMHSAKELEIILKHEQEHVRQHHTADLLLANILLVLQWCNPFAWLYKNYLEQNLEFLADNKTLQNNTNKRDYQLAMVRISATNSYPEITTNFYQSFIKKRIIMLNKNASKTQNLWKMGLIIPCIVAFIFSFNVKTVAQVKLAEETVSDIKLSSEVSYTVEKTSTEQDLKDIEDLFKERGADIDFNDISFTPTGTLKKIKLSYDNSITGKRISHTADSDMGITPFKMSVDQDGKVAVKKEVNSLSGTAISSNSQHIKNHEQALVRNKGFKDAGDNPLYIINTKVMRKKDFEGKTLISEGGFRVLNSKDAKAQYGNRASDGVFIFRGKTIVKESTKDAMPFLMANNNYIGFGITENKIPVTTKVNASSSNGTATNFSKKSTPKVLRLTITSETTDAELEGIKKMLEAEGASVKIKNVKRKGNIITGLKVFMEYKGKSQNYSLNDDDGIEPFSISLDNENDRISIGAVSSTSSVYVLNTKRAQDSSRVHANAFTFISNPTDTENVVIKGIRSGDTINVDGKVMMFKNTKHDSVGVQSIYFKTDDQFQISNEYATQYGKNGTVHFDTGFGETNPTFYIDDKEVLEKEVKKLDPDTIASVNVLKKDGNNEIRIYLKEK